ncbi:MAG: hypothetical protein HS122_19255 [Opitutaceae bacterium]|nr:hypothetical protein [Opitutaceae bacterium]
MRSANRLLGRCTFTSALLCGTVFPWLAGCASSPSTPNTPEAGKAGGVAAAEPEVENVLVSPIKPLPGPKRVVAVGRFDCIGSFRQNFGDWDIGGGISAMLSTALSESEQFIVVERSYISQILSEQELKNQRVVAETTGPQIGQLTGVQLLIYGAITEFGAENSGGGFSIGIAGLPSGLRAGLGPQFTKGKVAMDIRIVDTTTGQILSTYKVAEKLKGTSWDLSIGKDKMTMGNNFFKKTPLGEACRRAITQAVVQFAASAEKRPWQGRIVDIEGSDFSINAGARAGIKQGDRFQVFRTAKVIKDPDTGQVLSRKEQPIGTIEVLKVEDSLATGLYLADAAGDAASATIGDLVRPVMP